MARRNQTYAIRLAVEGGGQVKAELVSVGQSGEQSLKRIESAGDRASGGLKGLGRQAELLRTGIRTLGGALAGVATVGGLAALVDRSISAADAIGKTADKIGVGVEALQELRFAAKASGVEQQTLDMALQRFTRRAAEAAQGTGEAKDALAQMGIALRDQSGNLRRSEDLLGDVADAFARIEDPAERVRLAFKLFDSEGVALVNLLRGGSDALEEMRERARDLGIVLDEALVRDAERARTELDTLSQVISANLTRAALEAAPVIADLSSWLADVAGKAGIAWERLFDAPEEKSLRTLRYELDLASSTIEKLEARIQELRESPTLGFTTFLDTAQINALERKLDELRRARDQTQARVAFLEGPPATGVPAPASAPVPDDTAAVQDRAKSLERIARELEGTVFNITHEGSARIIAEHERRVAEIEALRARDGSNAEAVDRLITQSAAVRDAQLSQLRAKEVEAAEKVRAANERVVASLEAERQALTQTERERFVAQALSRLSAEATAEHRREVEQLAGALFDEQQALQARQRLLDEGRSVIDRTSITLAAADFGKSTMSVSTPAYDEQNDRLLLTAEFDDGTRRLVSYGKDDGIVWSRQVNSEEALPDQARFTGGKIYTFANGTAYIRDATDGALISSHGLFAASVGISGRMLFDESATTFYMTGTSAVHQVIAHRAIPGAMPLADIVTALCLRAGLTEDDLDVSELTDGVRGYALARQVSVRGALEMLAAAYMFDAVESDHRLKFKMRGREPSRVIPERDLVFVNAEGEAFVETRAQEVDLPVRFTVVYQDLERDADVGTQYAKRVAGPASAMHSRNEATFELPLTLTAAEAKGIALRQLHSAWLERTGYEWHLPWTHVDLEPADVVQVALDDGTLLNVRILETELGANLELAWKTVLEEKSAYDAVPVTQGGIGYRRVSNVHGSEARLFVTDIPLLDDADDVGRVMTGFYWGAGAYGAPWPACVLFQSEDGTIYAAADTGLAAVTWGAVVNVLGPTATPFQTDLVNTLEIALVGGDAPESVTTEEMLAGANRAAVIRADGTAEIIHFQDVTVTDAGTYVLSTLLRGRRGTEVYVALHEPGEMFVMLDDSAATLRRLLPLDRVGKTLHLAAVARGGDAGNSKPQTIELAGSDLKPYAPVHLAASGSFGADITLSWVRRTRVGGDLKDGFGTVLLAEDAEEYELEILGPDDDVRRTVTGLTSLTFAYTTAMQAEDFPEGYPASAFVVYQISAQVGRGFAARFDFPDAPQLATLGESIAEGQAGGGTSNFPADTVMAQRYDGVSGQVLSAFAYLGSSAGGNMRMGLYADNAGEPGALIATTEAKAFSATSSGHWEEFTFASPPATVGGVKYWLACHTDVSVNSRGSDGSNQNDTRRLISQSYASGLPDPYGAGSSYSNTRGMKMLVWTNPT